MTLTKSYSFSLKRKRILICGNSNCKLEHFCVDFDCFTTPMKKLRVTASTDSRVDNSVSSLLESLPQELLINVVCGVDHDDLKQLFLVSKTVRDAAIIAKSCHFAYSTPAKTKAFNNSIEMLNNLENCCQIEAPKAPKPCRRMKRRCVDRETVKNIAVKLFADEVVNDEMQRWSRRSLFMDIETS